MALFVRYRATAPNGRGIRPGIFALVNGLARDGELSTEDEHWRRAANARFDAAYADPSLSDPGVYDRERNPGAVAWFRTSAAHLLAELDGYLDLLDRHGVEWERVESDAPGRIVYANEVQVIVVPQ